MKKENKDLYDEFDVKYIWKQGFPTDHDRTQALTDAESTARLSGDINPDWDVVKTDIIETQEHIDAGQFLACLYFGNTKEPV